MTRYQLLKTQGIHDTFTFGKHKGKTLLEVLESDAQYILAFPYEEMRDAFKENFDPDIEICKMFL